MWWRIGTGKTARTDLETMQIITESKGIVSEKTLLGKHPFVEDVNSEMEQLERERKGKEE